MAALGSACVKELPMPTGRFCKIDPVRVRAPLTEATTGRRRWAFQTLKPETAHAPRKVLSSVSLPHSRCKLPRIIALLASSSRDHRHAA